MRDGPSVHADTLRLARPSDAAAGCARTKPLVPFSMDVYSLDTMLPGSVKPSCVESFSSGLGGGGLGGGGGGGDACSSNSRSP